MDTKAYNFRSLKKPLDLLLRFKGLGFDPDE